MDVDPIGCSREGQGTPLKCVECFRIPQMCLQPFDILEVVLPWFFSPLMAPTCCSVVVLLHLPCIKIGERVLSGGGLHSVSNVRVPLRRTRLKSEGHDDVTLVQTTEETYYVML